MLVRPSLCELLLIATPLSLTHAKPPKAFSDWTPEALTGWDPPLAELIFQGGAEAKLKPRLVMGVVKRGKLWVSGSRYPI